MFFLAQPSSHRKGQSVSNEAISNFPVSPSSSTKTAFTQPQSESSPRFVVRGGHTYAKLRSELLSPLLTPLTLSVTNTTITPNASSPTTRFGRTSRTLSSASTASKMRSAKPSNTIASSCDEGESDGDNDGGAAQGGDNMLVEGDGNLIAAILDQHGSVFDEHADDTESDDNILGDADKIYCRDDKHSERSVKRRCAHVELQTPQHVGLTAFVRVPDL